MTERFPLLNLPTVAFDVFYKFLTIEEVIQLAQCSSTLQSIIKTSKTRLKTAKLDISLTTSQCSLFIEAANHDRMNWYLGNQRNKMLASSKSRYNWRISKDVTLKVSRDRIRWFFEPQTSSSYEQDFILLVQWLCKTLGCKINSLSFNCQGNFNFYKLFGETNVLHKARAINVYRCAFSKEEMAFMFDNFDTEDLMFMGYGGLDFVYQKPLNFPKLILCHATWITGKSFLDLGNTCKNVRLENALAITETDCNQFIKNWLSSDNKSLEVMIVNKNSLFCNDLGEETEQTPFEREKILEGIATRPGSRRDVKPDRNFLHAFRFENGVDIQRDDGLLASVVVTSDGIFHCFVFVVWHDKKLLVDE